MFSHVMFGVNDLERSKKFYDALLGTLGVAPGVANKNRYFYRSPAGTFGITTPINGAPGQWRHYVRRPAGFS
jgi:catechol 2,3-dioxygenase-like lactoylglutathione lyase family enzyme